MSERNIQNRILVRLSKDFAGRGIFWKNDTGVAKSMDGKRVVRFGCPGSPDIIGCVDGLFVGFEVKTRKGKQTDKQKKFQIVLERSGGLYCVPRSAEEAVGALNDFLNAANASPKDAPDA